MKDYYQLLGIERSAGINEIKNAYRKLAKKFHPDKHQGDKFYEERFKEIQEAYNVLSNPIEKKRYDEQYDQFFLKERYFSSANMSSNGSRQPFEQEYPQNNDYNSSKISEKERIRMQKRNAKLSFEDLSWMSIGSLFTMGILSVILSLKFFFTGYRQKAKQVCIATLVVGVIFMFLSLIATFLRS